ncbi:MAG TPA: NAD(P)-binding domain-containing protein [Pyrinomonadaceae bacterium]|jgi:cation diffusion facilitator CzcD-associated flavoprotein CzcO|nr:NAD(P)-binding domain-containing protein [Pyrinomonadaceae bacterium]
MKTDLLIIGAGPFGMALAAQAQHDKIEHLIVGKAMETWRKNMPKGMFLRSACDWHLDPQNVHTIEAYLQTQNKTPTDVEPLSLDFYLSYAEWFQQQKQIHPIPIYVERLDHNGHFVATTSDGEVINAERVVLAPGFKHFAHVPEELKPKLPAGRYQHTAEFIDFSKARGKRFLIIGGRQSAFEWAALLLEAGAAAVHLSHRHASPAFAVADWSWVSAMVDNIVTDPNWFRRLSQTEKDAVSHRLWSEGRLKIEPWLEARLNDHRLKVWPQTELESCTENLEVRLTNGETFNVDQIVLATGYKVNIARLPYLTAGNLPARLETRNGFPALDDHFETSVPGLFITSMPAGQDFGPFFGFTISVRTSAKLICERLLV